MRGELVAVDLETTGLDPSRDEIIEIGAVRVRDGVIVDEFSTFVNPGRSVPANITHLTGIRADDLLDAPSIKAALPLLSAFVGDTLWMAHNISFDAAFLNRRGALLNNVRIDTYELASFLLPRAARYNLTSLTSLYGFNIESAHRALYDARATAFVYQHLWDKLLALPFATLREIAEMAQGLPSWDALPVLNAALHERHGEAGSAIPIPFTPYNGDDKPLRPGDDAQPIDPENVVNALDDDGAFAATMPSFEYRPQQITMAHRVAEAFNRGEHVLIEAGTGTGKSVAYLVPAALWAVENQQRVVISTNTINLQDQLMEKDIPVVRAALDQPFNAAVMKGRSNYLCPRRLESLRRRKPTSIDELRTLAKILVWLNESQTGDRGEISLRGVEENLTWQRLSAEDEGCTLDRCAASMAGACPYYKARKTAEAAHLVIVNHALLISDATSDSRVIPDYRYLIVDEAHHLEEATTSGLSFRIDADTLRRRRADLGTPTRGLLGGLITSAEKHAPEKDVRRLSEYASIISEAADAMEIHIGRLFNSLRALVQDMNIPRGEYLAQVRITEAVRARPVFSSVAETWRELQPFFEGVADALNYLATGVRRLEKHNLPDYADLVSAVEAAAQYWNEVRAQLTRFVGDPDPNTIYWLSVGQDSGYFAIQSAPLHIGGLIDQHVWSSKNAVVMTSATLQTNGGFDYIRERLHGEYADTLEVGSPFNYHDSTLLFLPNDIPDPKERHQYQAAIERGLIELTAALNGRVMALFTSYSHLRQTSQAITPRLALGNITVYDQSDGTSRQALLDGFKTTEKAILLGTRSFWEGVDIPGESLSALVIVRLPFAVPTDPVFAARAETYADSFNQYTLPDAILRFRQGFGRLIRSKTDRGVVTVFDSRVITKSYGASFVAALPDCTVQHGSMSELPNRARQWIERP